PHPTSAPPPGRSCMLPWLSASSLPGLVKACWSVAVMFVRSSFTTRPRDCGSSCGVAALSKIVISPVPAERTWCWWENFAPGPKGRVGVLPAEPPFDLAVPPADLVDGPGVAGGDQQVAVPGHIDRVDVEVVVRVV